MSGIYESFCEAKDYDSAIQDCIENTVQKLLKNDTNIKKPGMLLGKVQSGKTRAFIGIIGLAFDKGYDLAVVLTKGTTALAKQTYERLCQEFDRFVEEDIVKIYDIMNMPGELTLYIRRQRLIFVVKKETHNLDKLVELFEKYDDFKEKQVLIVDDEADYASVGFKKDKEQIDEISINTLAVKIDKLRRYGAKANFLQVTATPYSLYLQPENMAVNGNAYHPVRPVFTELVPVHDKYVGSEFYFEESDDPDSLAFYLHIDVPEKELEVLGKRDQRYINNILTTPNLAIFRAAIINFIVGGVIRRLQEQPKNYKCSCIIHTETSKDKHSWQLELVDALINALSEATAGQPELFEELIEKSYKQFCNPILRENLPPFSEVLGRATQTIVDRYIGISKINSEGQVEALLDRKGQLRLDNPLNIFIGGQILDRGITVENLICFFYGRNPKRFQQDTVLQHSRMYGARSQRDIGVTRFYTSARIYSAMKKMHHFDAGLRDAFEKDQQGDDGVVFLEKDKAGEVQPCAPNKILISSTETIRPYRRLLPRGMQTVSQTKMTDIESKISHLLDSYNFSSGEPILIDWRDAVRILEYIKESYEFSDRFSNTDYEWDVSAHKAIIKYLCNGHSETNKNGKIYCVVRKNRNSRRSKADGAYNDAPDDGQTDRPLAKDTAIDLPILQLFQQNGKEELGWRNVPFWWPVLVCPKSTKTSVFASETL